jgi:hypothetical protein
MKYALRFAPAESATVDAPLWLWWHEGGAYYCERQELYYPDGPPRPSKHRPHYVVKEAPPRFIDTMLDAGLTSAVERIPFTDVPEQMRDHDPSEVLGDPLWITDVDNEARGDDA